MEAVREWTRDSGVSSKLPLKPASVLAGAVLGGDSVGIMRGIAMAIAKALHRAATCHGCVSTQCRTRYCRLGEVPRECLHVRDRRLALLAVAQEFSVPLMHVLQPRALIGVTPLALEVRDEVSAADALLEAKLAA